MQAAAEENTKTAATVSDDDCGSLASKYGSAVSLLHHAAHSGVHGGSCGSGFRFVSDHTLGGEEHAGYRSCVLQCYTGNLGRVDDAFCSATRVTLVGSMTPAASRFS